MYTYIQTNNIEARFVVAIIFRGVLLIWGNNINRNGNALLRLPFFCVCVCVCDLILVNGGFVDF